MSTGFRGLYKPFCGITKFKIKPKAKHALEPSDFRNMHKAIMSAQGRSPVSDDGLSHNALVNSGILELYKKVM